MLIFVYCKWIGHDRNKLKKKKKKKEAKDLGLSCIYSAAQPSLYSIAVVVDTVLSPSHLPVQVA